MGEYFSVGEELCHMDDVRMRMHFILHRKAFFHNLACLHPFYDENLERLIITICFD